MCKLVNNFFCAISFIIFCNIYTNAQALNLYCPNSDNIQVAFMNNVKNAAPAGSQSYSFDVASSGLLQYRISMLAGALTNNVINKFYSCDAYMIFKDANATINMPAVSQQYDFPKATFNATHMLLDIKNKLFYCVYGMQSENTSSQMLYYGLDPFTTITYNRNLGPGIIPANTPEKQSLYLQFSIPSSLTQCKLSNVTAYDFNNTKGTVPYGLNPVWCNYIFSPACVLTCNSS